jgi:geranylgeranyl reductase family protein
MISIIGAGPVGNHVAALLAKDGHDVHVFEGHAKIGIPIQCTGITTFFLNDLTKIDDSFLVNTISRTRVYSPNMDFVDIPLKKNFVVDRTKFDSYLADVAKSEGAQYHLGHRYTHGTFGKTVTTHFANGKTFASDVLIGADGPRSHVAKSRGMYGERTFIIGHQARIALSCEEDLVEFFLGEGYFGWLVPESKKIARLGICSMRNAKEYFDLLSKKRKGKILEWQSGIIPLYNPRLQTEQHNVYLIGDAATQVKATTLGGIIPGMIAGEALARSLNTGKSYQKLWKKSIGMELYVHLQIHRMLQKFTDTDYNKLIQLVKQERITRAITEHDREFPSKLMIKLLFREPRFLQFAKYLF